MATGLGFSHKSKFIELASFVNKDDNLGLFTFLGSTLHTKRLDENWELHTNWFGELTYFPVWNELRNIPFGATKSYKEQAGALNNPNAVRAVANANGMNRISIINPRPVARKPIAIP